MTPEIERATVFGQSARAVFEEFTPDRAAAMAPLFAARAEVVAGLRRVLRGQTLPGPHPGWHPSDEELDRWNREQVAIRASWTVNTTLTELGEARGAWYTLMLGLSDVLFWDPRTQEWNARRARHDETHLPGIRKRIQVFERTQTP